MSISIYALPIELQCSTYSNLWILAHCKVKFAIRCGYGGTILPVLHDYLMPDVDVMVQISSSLHGCDFPIKITYTKPLFINRMFAVTLTHFHCWGDWFLLDTFICQLNQSYPCTSSNFGSVFGYLFVYNLYDFVVLFGYDKWCESSPAPLDWKRGWFFRLSCQCANQSTK